MFFRDALIDDLPIIVAIYNSTIAGRMVTADTTPVAVADKVQWFNQHNKNKRPLWVVENDDKKIIGWVSFQNFYGRPAYSGTAEISIYLDETQRGKSYGKKILEYAIEKSSSLGIHTLLGFIFAQNIPSIHLFEKLGFEEWANLKDVAVLDGKTCSLKILGRKINN
ncbi:MAG: GNAT family N-acetyltransferase [Ferruginibacter sp.]